MSKDRKISLSLASKNLEIAKNYARKYEKFYSNFGDYSISQKFKKVRMMILEAEKQITEI